MKKRFGKIKRFIAMLLVGITLSSSVFYSYSLPVQATTVLPAAQTLVEALMTIFGYSLGFGKSVDGFSSTLTSSVFESVSDSVLNGGELQFGTYGAVDFSDEVAVFDFLNYSYKYGLSIAASEAYDKLMSAYDYATYKTSGVSSTKTMSDILGRAVSKYETEGTSALKEDMQHALTVIEGGSGDGEEPDDFNGDDWLFSSALMAALLSMDDFNNVDWDSVNPTIEAVDFTEYTQRDLGADGLDYFVDLPRNSNGYFEFDVYYTDKWGKLAHYYMVFKNVACYIDGNCIYCYAHNGHYQLWADDEFYGTFYSSVYAEECMSFSFPSNAQITGVIPAFSSVEEAQAVVFDETYDNAINKLNSETVSVFYESTPTSTVPEYVVNFMTRTPSTDDVTSLAAALTELSTETAGTTAYIPAVESVVQTATDSLPEASTDTEETPEESVEQEQDPETGNFNYFNILQLILNAIKAIAESVWAFFENPMAGILSGINNLIELVPGCFELVRGWIEVLPSSIYQFFEAPLLAIQEGLAAINPFETWWPRLQPYLDQFLAYFQSSVPEADLTDPDIPSTDDGGNGKHSFDILNLLNGLWLLIMILLMLLVIFVHLMIFIINIFKIPATTGYLPDGMILGLDYLKSLEITGIGMSVYDFMMGLVYILMVFGVVKVLRQNIYHIKVPKAKRGGL